MRRAAAVVAMAFGFGAGDAVVCASGRAGFVVGNMSAFWLLLAFLAGCTTRRLPVAAWLGLAATLAAFVGFYLVQIFAGITVSADARRWIALGFLSGPVFGALGGLWRVRRSWLIGASIAAAFVVEPVAWWSRRGYLPRPVAAWKAEMLLGLLMLAVIMRVAKPVEVDR